MSIVTPAMNLKRMDERPIPEHNGEIRLFATIRNELLRLPYFLDYYRKQGVTRFIFTDNASEDGTEAYLLQQPDCHVYFTEDSYGKANSGILWQNALLDRHGTSHWCLVVDADEFLIYPNCEQVGLPQLCHKLSSNGISGLYTFMLDMYPETEMEKAVYRSGQNPLEICPMFDRDYHFVQRSFVDLMELPNRPVPFPKTEVIGGPRARLFYPEQNTIAVWPRLKPRVLGLWYKLLAKYNLVKKETIPHMAPILFKVPLVKWREGLKYHSSTHIITPIKLAEMTGILLHFKFFSDFKEKAELEAIRGEHGGGSKHYKRYAQGMRQAASKNPFLYEGTMRYSGSENLIKLGLMKRGEDKPA